MVGELDGLQSGAPLILRVFTITAMLTFSVANAQAGEPTKAECVVANSAAQDLRGAGKLREAHAKLALCVSASCPGAVREDCGERLRELEKATPSVVFEAKDGAGNDLSAVVVTVDGQPLAKKLDGTALVVDPGEHTFRFEAEGLPTVEKKLVVREGEKERRERVTLGASAAKETPEAPSSTTSPSRVPAIIAFGVGGIGLIVGFAFTGLWVSDKNAADAECVDPNTGARKCDGPRDEFWRSKQNGDTAGLAVGFVVAGAGAIVGTILVLASSGGSAPAKGSAARVQPRLGLGWAGIEGTF